MLVNIKTTVWKEYKAWLEINILQQEGSTIYTRINEQSMDEKVVRRLPWRNTQTGLARRSRRATDNEQSSTLKKFFFVFFVSQIAMFKSFKLIFYYYFAIAITKVAISFNWKRDSGRNVCTCNKKTMAIVTEIPRWKKKKSLKRLVMNSIGIWGYRSMKKYQPTLGSCFLRKSVHWKKFLLFSFIHLFLFFCTQLPCFGL